MYININIQYIYIQYIYIYTHIKNIFKRLQLFWRLIQIETRLVPKRRDYIHIASLHERRRFGSRSRQIIRVTEMPRDDMAVQRGDDVWRQPAVRVPGMNIIQNV